MPLFEMTSTTFRPVPEASFASMGIGERSDIQRLLRTQIDVLGDDLYVLTEEFGDWEDSRRRIDLLAVDAEANLVVVELKRTADGGHMELQAIRYASMVSAMTFERAVQIHADFLRRMGKPAEEAQAHLLEFLGWEEPNQEVFAEDVRIVLVSENFSKELTTAVLWLREREIDIRCVRLQPYHDDGKTLIDVEQIIPLPEAQDYMIRLREKEQQERKSKAGRWSAESQQFCFDYWQGVLDHIQPTDILEPGVKPMRKEDMRFKVGWPDFWLKAYFSRRDPKMAVWFACRGEQASEHYGVLDSHRAEISQAFGGPLEWRQDDDLGRWSISRPFTGFDANDKADWPRQHEALAEAIVGLYRALKPFVEPLIGQQQTLV